MLWGFVFWPHKDGEFLHQNWALCPQISSNKHPQVHTRIFTCSLSQVSVITVFQSGGCTFQRSSRPLDLFWTPLCYIWQWERDQEREEGREECCLWEEKEVGVNVRKAKPSQFLWALLTVGYTMSAVAFLSAWEETALFSFFFTFFGFYFLSRASNQQESLQISSQYFLDFCNTFVLSLLLLFFLLPGKYHAGGWRGLQAQATLCHGHQASAYRSPHP